jgi:hypothetical protein
VYYNEDKTGECKSKRVCYCPDTTVPTPAPPTEVTTTEVEMTINEMETTDQE